MKRRRSPFGSPVIVGKVKAPDPIKPTPEPKKVTAAEIDLQGEERPGMPSMRLGWWLEYVSRGWRPDGRLRTLGYLDAAKWFGVYVWEFRNVLVPAMREPRPPVVVPRSQLVLPT